MHFKRLPTNANEKRTIYILADVTDWFNGVGYSEVNFVGNIFFSRDGYSDGSYVEVVACVSYKNLINNPYLNTCRLFSSEKTFIPCILKYTEDDIITYKLALKFNQTMNYYHIWFNGITFNINEITAIYYPMSQDLPDGYELAFEKSSSICYQE